MDPPSRNRSDIAGHPEGKPTYRLGLGLSLVAASLAVSLSAAWDLAGPKGVLPAPLLSAVIWIGLASAGFLSLIVGASATSRRWEQRIQKLGRRGGSAVLLVGLGSGLLVIAFGWSGVAYLTFRPWRSSVMSAGMALLAGGMGVAVMVTEQVPVRAALTLGALIAGASGALLPSHFLLSVTVPLALLVIFQAWTSAPPTVNTQEW